ncbi:MAG TPA: PP2C family protein-serine/threonine phosphatase [Streptosporangiaceae bacterium]
MSDDIAGPRDGTAPRYLPPADPVMPGNGTDLAGVAALIIDAAVPRFADAAGVYVLEQLLSTGNPAAAPAAADVVVRRLGTGFARRGDPAGEAAFPSGEVIAFAADSRYARCVHDGIPAVFGQPEGMTLERINPGARQVLSRYASFLAAPMAVGGSVIGFLILARSPGAPAYDDPGMAAAALLAARAGTGIASTLALMQQSPAATTPGPVRPALTHAPSSRLDIAGRCLPAAGYETGGDWYDIIWLPGDRTGLIVGDVMGHGTTAAAVMAQFSAAAHALAALDLPPGEVLRQLNRTALALPNSPLATCVYAIIDPGAQSCTIATAGHLPPVLAMPDGTTRVPTLPGGQSLGVSPADYGQARIKLPPGAILAAYTDGLVETRTRPFDQGIRALRSMLSTDHPYLNAVCDSLISSLGEDHEDDITVVLARIPAPPAGDPPALGCT